ncbi:hypothetical protein SPI_05564 [Niveomyces insectorum RCEF 264]|uniref:Uncharacterized protein n=1 Tax=Niveomyces insectorum RCEF 264 TaxID=1081102 RepID=A0A167TC18_9HYPO|nr:hypothetical protein SPI_05564 [Niveomyces insectorum RCEF 264]
MAFRRTVKTKTPGFPTSFYGREEQQEQPQQEQPQQEQPQQELQPQQQQLQHQHMQHQHVQHQPQQQEKQHRCWMRALQTPADVPADVPAGEATERRRRAPGLGQPPRDKGHERRARGDGTTEKDGGNNDDSGKDDDRAQNQVAARFPRTTAATVPLPSTQTIRQRRRSKATRPTSMKWTPTDTTTKAPIAPTRFWENDCSGDGRRSMVACKEKGFTTALIERRRE